MSQIVDQVPVYDPNGVTSQASSSHSNGSFGPVFIILAIILVVTIVACVVGRICSRRHHKSKPKPTHAVRSKEKGGGVSARQNHDFRPKLEDIEFGFDKALASSKVAASDGFRSFKPSSHHGEGKGSHMRFADDIEFRPGP